MVVIEDEYIIERERVPTYRIGHEVFFVLNSTQFVKLNICDGKLDLVVDLKQQNPDSIAELFYNKLPGDIKPSEQNKFPPIFFQSSGFVVEDSGFANCVSITIPTPFEYEGQDATLIQRYPLMIYFNDKGIRWVPFEYKTKFETNQPVIWFSNDGIPYLSEAGLIMNSYSSRPGIAKLSVLGLDDSSRFQLIDSIELNKIESKYSDHMVSLMDRIFIRDSFLLMSRGKNLIAQSTDGTSSIWAAELNGYILNVNWGNDNDPINVLTYTIKEQDEIVLSRLKINLQNGKIIQQIKVDSAQSIIGAVFAAGGIDILKREGENIIYSFLPSETE